MTPARLGKNESNNNEFGVWLLNHANIIVPVLVILLFIFIGIFIAVIIGNISTTPMVESGNYYNHFKDVI